MAGVSGADVDDAGGAVVGVRSVAAVAGGGVVVEVELHGGDLQSGGFEPVDGPLDQRLLLWGAVCADRDGGVLCSRPADTGRGEQCNESQQAEGNSCDGATVAAGLRCMCHARTVRPPAYVPFSGTYRRLGPVERGPGRA